ncbi:hypothetical protein FB451DRAFT_1185246 [Mycena latifolia]|nr:hypothetical protein FB451DRAFT_1185246 [Mycena latifolia]
MLRDLGVMNKDAGYEISHGTWYKEWLLTVASVITTIMPLQPTAAQIRFHSIVSSLSSAVATLDMVSASFKTSLEPTSNTMHSLLTAVQVTNYHQTQCTIWGNSLSKTIHKIHTYVEAQQEKSKLKQFFLSRLNEGIAKGLSHGAGASTRGIQDTSDPGCHPSQGYYENARACAKGIRGSARYDQHRDTTSNIIQLAGLIGAHVGLTQGTNLTQPVAHPFTRSPPSLLILDNLETIWGSGTQESLV